ncbi:MAG: hypothetical protein AAFY36_12265 [Bacteroidota bacterium]
MNLDCNYDSTTDSTYRADTYNHLDVPYIYRDHLELPAVNNWKEAIRVEGHGGWGMFDYVCSIYAEADKRRLQLAYNSRTLLGDPFNFIVKEQFITPEEYNSLISDLNDLNICEYQFDLEPDYGLTDGPSFGLVAKQDTQLKALYWEDHPRNDDPETKIIFHACG